MLASVSFVLGARRSLKRQRKGLKSSLNRIYVTYSMAVRDVWHIHTRGPSICHTSLTAMLYLLLTFHYHDYMYISLSNLIHFTLFACSEIPLDTNSMPTRVKWRVLLRAHIPFIFLCMRKAYHHCNACDRSNGVDSMAASVSVFCLC